MVGVTGEGNRGLGVDLPALGKPPAARIHLQIQAARPDAIPLLVAPLKIGTALVLMIVQDPLDPGPQGLGEGFDGDGGGEGKTGKKK
jgi:hypothetical protein